MEKIVRPWLVYLILTVLIILLFSYRLTKVPPGLTVDEAAFGYNATLLAKTGHDENGKFLPFFVLSIGGQDWRQPVSQYFDAVFFKLAGASMFTLRFTSILIMVASLLLIFYLAKRLKGLKFAFLVGFIFLTTPIIMIQAHMALDNIMPVPFTVLWLIFLYLYERTGKSKNLFYAGIFLGINFYTYKAMRGIVPAWTVFTALYLFYLNLKNKKELKSFFTTLVPLGIGLLPFFIIIPFLKNAYPGAVFSGYRPHLINWNDFFYTFLSNLDLSFLFVKGDATVYHSTGRHGMFLLASLPLFILGSLRAVKEKNFWVFLLLAFFITPAAFGFVGSVHRASRMLAIVPMYALIAGLGFSYLWTKKSLIFLVTLVIISGLILVNYFDFLNYYWFTYPKFAKSDFSQTKEDSYRIFSETAKKMGRVPYVDSDLYKADGEVAHFYEAAYFDKETVKLKSDEKLPAHGLLMTYRENVTGLERLNLDIPGYFLYKEK